MVTVVTSGVFDLLNARHIEFLEKARKFGDKLVVLVNNDHSARLNGKNPVEDVFERTSKLRALKCVDQVKVFEEAVPSDYLIGHDIIYIKSSEYRNNLPEQDMVESYGGIVAFIPEIPGEHTSDLIKRIKERE